MGAINRLYAQYGQQVEFFVVYIREAHAADSSWPDRSLDVMTPQSFEERAQVAKTCSTKLDIKLPLLIDDMKNSADRSYSGWPDRLFLVGIDGKIAYAAGRGPWGFKPANLETAIKAELAASPSPTAPTQSNPRGRTWF